MCAESIQKHVSRGQQYEEAWNSSSVQLIKASEVCLNKWKNICKKD